MNIDDNIALIETLSAEKKNLHSLYHEKGRVIEHRTSPHAWFASGRLFPPHVSNKIADVILAYLNDEIENIENRIADLLKVGATGNKK